MGGLPNVVRGVGGHQVAQQAAIEQQAILQAQFDAELRRCRSSVTSAISTWIITCGGWASSFCTSSIDLVEEPRRGADDQRVAHRLGHDDHFAFDLLEGADRAGRGLLHLAFAAQELVDGVGHVQRRRVLQLIHRVLALLHVAVRRAAATGLR